MKKIIFTLIFWIILYHVYSEQVEAGSSGNKIAFTINNISNETITNANIEIISSPNWLSFSNQSLTIGSISAGASYNVEFDFSVSSAANGQGNVTFEINSDGIVWDASSNSELNIPITVNPLPDLIADFSSSTQTGSPGTTIQFYNSSSGDPTGFQWTFNGGTPSSSTDENPTVNYDNTGNYDVSLTITRNSESDTETKYSYITIEQNQFEISGKIEDFNQFTPIDYVLVEYIPNTSSQASESGSTFTNSNGDYNFTVSHGWEGTIKFSKNNYGTVVRSISSVENDRTLDQKLIFAQLECSWEYNPTAGANCIFITFASTVQFHHGEAQWNEIIGFSTITKTTTFFGSAVDNGFNVCFDDVIPGETYNNEVEVCIYDESNNLIGNCFNLSISFFYDLNTDCNHQPVNAQFQINGGKVFTKGSTVEFANTSSPQECILTSVWNFDNEHARDDCSWLQKQDCDNTCKYDEIMINTLWNGGSINDGFITEHTYNLKGKKNNLPACCIRM